MIQTGDKEFPALPEVQGDVGGYRELLIPFVEAQGITLDYSDDGGPGETTHDQLQSAANGDRNRTELRN